MPLQKHLTDSLAEIEDVIRNMPPRSTFHHHSDEILAWLGRATAAISHWDSTAGIRFSGMISGLHKHSDSYRSSVEIVILLHQARNSLRMLTLGPTNVAIGQGLVFDYFDQLRKQFELSSTDLFFVDPYLDAEFVSRYLPSAPVGTRIRLLGRERMQTLAPAANAFAQQSGRNIEIRLATGFHDRYLFVDKSRCFQSGASFKDGAKNAPTTITQIVDAFTAVLQTYESIWDSATLA